MIAQFFQNCKLALVQMVKISYVSARCFGTEELRES